MPKCRHWVLLSEAEESGAPFRRSTAPLGCAEIDENAAANGSARCRVANDEPVARRGRYRALQNELHECRLSRRDRLIAEQNHATGHLGRGVVQLDRKPLCNGLRLRR